MIAAMAQESKALIHYVEQYKRIAIGPYHGYSFVLAGRNCIVITSGMGVRRASQAAQNLMEKASLRLLISFGIAGAIEADLEIGDVVLVKAVCRLENGVIGPSLPLEPWPDAAREVMAQALASQRSSLFTGTAVTTSGSQPFEYKTSEMRHPVLEMETAGIAQVAAQKGIPLLALRAISDGPRAPLPVDVSMVMDDDANLKVGRMLATLIRNPRLIIAWGGIRRNSQVASDNAALALLAGLSQADFSSH